MCPRAEQAEPERFLFSNGKGGVGESLGVTGAAIERPFEGVLEDPAWIASLCSQ